MEPLCNNLAPVEKIPCNPIHIKTVTVKCLCVIEGYDAGDGEDES